MKQLDSRRPGNCQASKATEFIVSNKSQRWCVLTSLLHKILWGHLVIVSFVVSWPFQHLHSTEVATGVVEILVQEKWRSFCCTFLSLLDITKSCWQGWANEFTQVKFGKYLHIMTMGLEQGLAVCVALYLEKDQLGGQQFEFHWIPLKSNGSYRYSWTHWTPLGLCGFSKFHWIPIDPIDSAWLDWW